MVKGRSIATLLAIALFVAPVSLQAQSLIRDPLAPAEPSAPGTLLSPAAAARFLEIGSELAVAPNLTGPEADQAIILLTAAKSLNPQAAGVEPLLLKLATRHAEKNYADPVAFWLQRYVTESADRIIVADAVRYLLSRSGSLEDRQALLERVADKIRNKSPAVDSELATALGFLRLEQGVTEQAKWYLVQAYNNNKHNRVAFAKLAELSPNEIGPAHHLEQLRLRVRENPLDLNAALALATYAERLQIHDLAAQSYQYCAEMFRYLYPADPLPGHIYLPWAISSYNAVQGPPVCLQIAENIRSLNRFDILVEAIAGKAALRLGHVDEGRQILQQAAQTAEELFLRGQGGLPISEQTGEPVRPVTAKQLAWFYCFADPNPAKALDWANRAYSAEQDSPAAAALLAYALSINNQLEWAQPLLAAAEKSQIADLVQARMLLAAGNRAGAIQTIQAAVAKDPGSLGAERAKEWLRELGSAYAPPIDARALTSFLIERLGRAVIPRFTPPDAMIDVQFNVRGAELSYGSEIEGAVAIVNKASEPLVISEHSLFQGNIRVSASVTGDLTREIPNLLFDTIRTSLLVPPGRSLVHPLRLSTGELRDLLLTCPQAALDLRFTLYLDPVITERGEVTNRLVDVKPVTVAVRRPRLSVTPDFVQGRLTTVASAQETQRIQTARLFTGLLKEQYLMAEKGTLYSFYYSDHLHGQLRSSLAGPAGLLLGGPESQWAVRVNAMADMLTMPLDQEVATAVAKNLNYPYWPVRLMAVYVLARSPTGGFGSVLDWVAQNDKDEMVRSMALSLQSTVLGGASPRPLTPQLLPAARP